MADGLGGARKDLGANGEDPQDKKKKKRAPRSCRLPAFTLLSANEYKEVTRARVVGLDDRAGWCAGEGSQGCHENRGMAVECENGVCGNCRLQRRAFLRTSVREVSEGQWGLFLEEDGEAGDMVEEYVGECVTRETFEQMVPEVQKRERWYFCALTHFVVIDATRKGNYSRFVNHSCAPNAELTPWSVATTRRIVVTLIRSASEGDEITISYDYDDGVLRQQCWCGLPECRGMIRRLPPRPGPKSQCGSLSPSSPPRKKQTR
eukprot:1177657-Rhodomonas_salina.1